MPRPRLHRFIRFNPRARFYKPQGIPLRMLETVELTREEIEAIRLRHLKNLQQEEAAKMMKTSQSTYQRILTSAYEKMAEALVQGKAISISQ